ncbi:SPOR domain-containing protein [Teredinibacter purpureus]|uniref:SPOR domain-containing protein n=1 Tax=Teredinibacter purpureus TaxID=2731756 RepID=UPI0005F7EE9F|nr:SPOR domain-containing protein [Teredinibacter purpureus]
MRWIFLTLLFCNILAALWGLVFKPFSPAVESFAPRPFQYGAADDLVLLLDDRSAVVRADGEVPMPIVGAEDTSNKDGRPLCEIVGPFEGRALAESFVERLLAIDIRGSIKELELPAGSRYQVFLPPEPSLRDALRKLGELQAKRVDSYVIPKGEFENGISLGMFSREALANKQLVEMRAIGLSPEMNVIERTYWEIWVMLAPGDGGKMSEIAWSRVMDGINHLQKRQNFCLDVAS